MAPKVDITAIHFEVDKRKTLYHTDLLISTIRGLRGRRKLYGEAILRDAMTPIIQIEVKHAKDMDDLYDRFLRQLIHRGFRPLRSRRRFKGDRLEGWSDIDLSGYDTSLIDHAYDNVEAMDV